MAKTTMKPLGDAAYGFVRLILVRPFTEELKARGIDFAPTIHALGLDVAALDDPTRYVHAETMYGIFDALAETAKDPHLGFHVGSKLDFAGWPPFQTAVRNAKTVGQFMTEFISAVPSEANSVRHELSISSSGACYRIHRLIQTKASAQHTEAFGAAVFIRLFQAITGIKWKPEDVLIRTSQSRALPERVEGVRVERKAEGGLDLHFPTEWLYAPIQLHSALRTRTVQPTQLEDDVSLLNVFRATARTRLHDLGTGLDDLASAMGVTNTSLETALRREGTSAAKELRSLRLEIAKARLANETVRISAIAADLGYSDPAHFTRFFRGQTGQSPREFRDAQKHEGS